MKTIYRLLTLATFAFVTNAGLLAQTLDLDKQLKYCHQQVTRALAELRQNDGSYDYIMEPRNILNGDKQKGWNCRKATAEEWCDGFW